MIHPVHFVRGPLDGQIQEWSGSMEHTTPDYHHYHLAPRRDADGKMVRLVFVYRGVYKDGSFTPATDTDK